MNKRITISFIITAAIFAGCTQENISLSEETVSSATEHHIPVTKAQNRLLDIISQLDEGQPGTRGESIVGTSHQITSVATLGQDKKPITRGNESDAAYYVFRFGDNEGFAIMAADDRLPELLAVAAGTPDQNNPAADLPDSTFWVLPEVTDTVAIATDPTTPVDGLETDPNYIKLLASNRIKVHWGNGKPFSSRTKYYGETSNIELRMPSAGVAVAQLTTLPEYSRTLEYVVYSDSLPGYAELFQIDLKKLSKYFYGSNFQRDRMMAEQVGELYNKIANDPQWLTFNLVIDSVAGEEYMLGRINVYGGVSRGEIFNDRDMIFQPFFHFGFSREICSNFTWYSISQLRSFFESGRIYVRTGSSSEINPECYLVHNVLYRYDNEKARYFLVNKCRDGNGDGYYYSDGFVPEKYTYSFAVKYQ